MNRGVQLASGRYVLLLDGDRAAHDRTAQEHLLAQHETGGAVVVGRAVRDGDRSPDPLQVDWNNISVPRNAFNQVGGLAKGLGPYAGADLAFRLQKTGLPIWYAPGAPTSARSRVSLRSLMGEASARGEAARALVRRHPESFPRLPLAAFAERSLSELVVLRGLLALRVPPPVALVALGGAAAVVTRKKEAARRVLESHSFWSGVRRSGPDRAEWERLTRPPVVLMYHSVGRGGEPATMWRVPARRFARQLSYLRLRRIRVIGLDELLRERAEGPLPPGRSVVITFDDGYRDNLTEALPLLRRRNHPATVFVVTSLMGGRNSWDTDGDLAGREIMSWDDAREMVRGGVAIASHTLSHPRLSKLTDEQVEAELAESLDSLGRELDEPPGAFAYPFGDYDARIRRLVETVGYLGACTVRSGSARPLADRYELPRVTVAGTDGLLAFAVGAEFGFVPRFLARRRPAAG